MAIKAFSGGIQNQPLPEINLTNVQDGDILVYKTANKAFENTVGSFTTLDQVNALIANINSGGSIDLSNYATTTSLNTEVTNLTALINSKTDEAYVDAKIAALPGPVDLSDYIDTATFNGALSNYDTSTVIDGKINTAVANATFFDGDYNNLFNTPTIPSLDGYATQLWVQQQINAIPSGGGNIDPWSIDNNGNFVPDANEAYDIGSPTARVRDIYMSGNSLYFEEEVLTKDTQGNLLWQGNDIRDYNQLKNLPDLSDLTSNNPSNPNRPVKHSDLDDYLTEAEIDVKIANITGGGSATTLSGLTDVDTTNATAGQVLKYDGNSWAPADDSTTGGGGTDADTLDGFDSQYYLDYNNLNNTPAPITPFSGDYNDLTNTPTIPTPFSGDYNDLTNRPTLFDGQYSSLIGAPTVPTDLSQLTDTNNLLSGAAYTDTSVDTHINKATAAAGQVLGWDGSDYVWVNNTGGSGGGATSLGGLSDVSNTTPSTGQILKWNGTEWAPAVDATTGVGGSNYATESYVDQKLTERGPHFSGDYNDLTNTPILFSGDYNDLLNRPAGNADLRLELVGNDLQLLNIEPEPDTIISTVSLASLGTAIASNIDYEDLANLPNLFSGDYNDLVNRPNLFSGNYDDLANKPYIPSIAGLASTNYVDSVVAGATTGDKVFEGNVTQVAKVSNVVAASQDNYIMAVTTTDATITEVLLTSGNRITIEDDSTVMYDIHVVGADSTEHHGVKIKGIIDRTSGTIALVGSPAKEILVENDDGWNADVVADTVNGSLKITVQGEASRTVNWTIFVELKTVKR